MISFKELSEKASAVNGKISRTTWIWIALGLAALPALRIYYVQEMLAALIGFSLLFAVIYIAVFAVFLLVRATKPLIVRAMPEVGRVARSSVEAAEGVIASPVWAKAVPVRPKALPVWAKSVPAWARAVPVWARTVPHRFRSQSLRLNENYMTVYSRVARLRLGPGRVYRATLQTGLQKGGVALNVGLRAGLCTQRRISKGVGNWLTQRVTYADLIRLPSIPRFGSLRSRAQARRRR